VRIISGKYKGKVLNPGKSFHARPTTDFAKESLFNILANQYDFDSRDCIHIESVELNHKHAAFISKMAHELKLNQLKVRNANAFHIIKSCIRKYDIIFADPPYEMEGIETLPELILNKDILKENGVFIFEHSKKFNFSEHPRLADYRSYGSVNFSFFK